MSGYLTCCRELVRVPLSDRVTRKNLPSADGMPLSLVSTCAIRVARNGGLVLRLENMEVMSYATDLSLGSRKGVDELLHRLPHEEYGEESWETRGP